MPAPLDATLRGGDLGVVGWFDHWSFDLQVRRLVVTAELDRRVPGRVRTFAPFGAVHPQPFKASSTIEPLAPDTAARTALLRRELAAVVVVASAADVSAVLDAMPTHPAVTADDLAPVAAWFAEPGLPAFGDVPTDDPSAHLGLLASRHWSRAVCSQRLEFLRAMQWWPSTGAPVVVAASTPSADRSGAVVHLGAGDRSFLARVAGAAASHYAIDPALAAIEDLVAAIAGADRVETDDAAVAAVAASFGRPVDWRGTGPAPSEGDSTRAALDAHLDLIAATVAAPRSLTDEGADIATARSLAELSRAVAHERVVLADYVAALRNEIARLTAERDAAIARSLRGRLAAIARRSRPR